MWAKEKKKKCVCAGGRVVSSGGEVETRDWTVAVVANRVVNDPGSLGFGSRQEGREFLE